MSRGGLTVSIVPVLPAGVGGRIHRKHTSNSQSMEQFVAMPVGGLGADSVPVGCTRQPPKKSVFVFSRHP